MRCLDENVLAEYVDDVLPSERRRTVEQHIDGCATCRALVSDLVRMQHAIAETLERSANRGDPDAPTVALPLAPRELHSAHTLDLVRYRKRASQIVVGTMIGEYEVTGLIGSGGMGVVFAAVHPRIRKRVAIKVLQRDLANDPTALVRFENEALAVNAIGHPNLVDIFAFGELPNGDPYYVMEHVEGTSLYDWITARTTVSLDEALPILRQICDALDAAHERGIVHRDLKPGNVMIGGSPDAPRVKVLDFGLAKMALDDSMDELTVPGIAIGTPHFMSPEQYQGQEVDRRTDVYALGVLTYQMLCGCYPFVGDTPTEIGNKHLYSSPTLPAHVRGRLPAHIDHILGKALAKDAADRYGSARAFREDIERCAAVATAPTRLMPATSPPSAPAPPRAASSAPAVPARRIHPSPLLIGGGVLALALAVIVILGATSNEAQPAATVELPAPAVEQVGTPIDAASRAEPPSATPPPTQRVVEEAKPVTEPPKPEKRVQRAAKQPPPASAPKPRAKPAPGASTADDDRMLLENGAVKR